MFHSFDYPDETGVHSLRANFWRPLMLDGVINFSRPADCTVKKEIQIMTPKRFDIHQNLRDANAEATELGV